MEGSKGDICLLRESLDQYTDSLFECHMKLSEAKKMTDELVTFIDSTDGWKGETKLPAIALLKLNSQFLDKLVKISATYTYNINQLKKDSETFLDTSDVLVKWGQEC